MSSSVSSTSDENTNDQPRVRELQPEEVRWFYKKNAGDHLWCPMNGSDSLKIETAYREHRAWTCGTIENASATDANAGNWARNVIVLDGLYELTYEPVSMACPLVPGGKSDEGSTSSETEGRDAAKGPRMNRFPYRLRAIYWKENSFILVRGTWFLEVGGGSWQPLDGSSPDLVRRVEAQHLRTFANQQIRSTVPAKLSRVVCEVKDVAEQRKPGTGAEVRWYGVDDILLYSHHTRTSKLWRYLNLNPSGTRLWRGYRSKARADDGSPPFTDLIFVIHGIGQKIARSKIIPKVAELRDTSDRLLRTHFVGKKFRPLLLPVDWRTELELDEHAVESITPNCLQTIRGFFNSALMDLMYYASPVHGVKITHTVSAIMNRMYTTFVGNHPEFLAQKGRVCIAAHSLGAVIAHDILAAGTEPLGVEDRLTVMARAVAETSRLAFPVQDLFCFGSPLGLFLVARNIRGRRILNPPGGAPGFRLYNIYHPADPVAYRIEPLVSEIYENIQPLRIHRANASNPKPYDTMPNVLLIRRSTTSSGTPSSRAGTPSSETTSSATPSSGTPVSSSAKNQTSVLQGKETSQVDSTTVQTEPVSTVKKVKQKIKRNAPTIAIRPEDALSHRIDHEVIRGPILNEYLSALYSHDSYWKNHDVVMFVLSSLYGVPNGGKSKKKK